MLCTDVRVLIADADDRWRDTVRRFFTQCGFPIETAADGLDCMAKLHAHEPDVLVVDMDIPWGGGDGVLARLEEVTELSKTPVVLVLGFAAPTVLSARAGVADAFCYQKPIRMQQLMDAVCMASGVAEHRNAAAADN